jgi:hypothetical protein
MFPAQRRTLANAEGIGLVELLGLFLTIFVKYTRKPD